MLSRATIKYPVIATVTLTTIVISARGFSSLSYPAIDNSLHLMLLFALATAVLSAICRMPAILAGSGLITVMTLACGQAWPMLMVALFGLSSTVLGNAILGRRENLGGPVYLLLGAGILGTITGIAAHYPINYAWSYTTLLLLPLLICRQQARALIRQLYGQVASYRSTSLGSNILDILIASLAGLYVALAFMPEIGHDALAMHLFIPAQLAELHQWGFDAQTYVWAQWPMLGDWMYGLVYMLAGETAARLVNTAFILIVAWQIRELVSWAGGSSHQSRWAILIFLSTPVVYSEGSTLLIDAAWTAFMMAGTLSLLKISDSTNNDRDSFLHLLLTGLLLGFALAAKAVTLSILPVLFLALVLQFRAWIKPGLSPYLITGTACFLLAGAIPYAFSWYSTGNPVFPFFNTLFHSPLWPSVDFQPPAAFGKGTGWDTLYKMTFASERYIEGKAGAAGFQWLLVPLAATILLFRRLKKPLGILLIAAGALIITYHSMAYLRYALPSFAMVSAVLALALPQTSRSIKIAGIVTGSMLLALNVWFIQSSTYYGRVWPTVLLSDAARDTYLTENLPTRKLVEMVNILNIAQQPVAVFASPFTAGLKSDALYTSWYNVKWYAEYDKATTEEDLVNTLSKRNVDWLIIDPTMLTEEKLRLLVKVSTPVAKLGAMELRKLSDASRYTQETLKNPDLSSSDGWSLSSPSIYDSSLQTLNVSVSSPATQAVAVDAGRSYKTRVSTRCSGQPTEGRVQVNWNDAKGSFITTNIEIYKCSDDWKSHEMIVTAPKNAATAIVYASGHTEIPLAFKSVSFKK